MNLRDSVHSCILDTDSCIDSNTINTYLKLKH